MTDENLPLTKRVCFSLMSSGILSPTGVHPLCLGPCCSNYEWCLYIIAFHEKELSKLTKRSAARHGLKKKVEP